MAYGSEHIFNNALAKTNNLSRTLQSRFTVITATAYFNRQGVFGLQREATFSKVKSVPIPRKLRGLVVVLAVLSLHYILLGIILLAFFFYSNTPGASTDDGTNRRAPRTLGQSWKSVAEVGCGAPKEFLGEATTSFDLGMGERLNITGWKNPVELRYGARVAIYPSGWGTSDFTITPEESKDSQDERLDM